MDSARRSSGAVAGERIATLRTARHWSQRTLARVAGVSSSYVPLLETGGVPSPSQDYLDRLARALGWPESHTMLSSTVLEPPPRAASTEVGPFPPASPAAPDPRWNVEQHGIIEPHRPADEGWPIYDAAGAGNPVASDEADRPLLVDRRQLEGEQARVIGRNGFGIRVVGECLNMWRIHSGDTVWINPDLAPRVNRPNLFLVQLDGDWGKVLRVLRSRNGRLELVEDSLRGEGEPLAYEAVVPIGPVVWHTPAERVPRRRSPLEDAEPLADQLERLEAGALRSLNGETVPPGVDAPDAPDQQPQPAAG